MGHESILISAHQGLVIEPKDVSSDIVTLSKDIVMMKIYMYLKFIQSLLILKRPQASFATTVPVT